MHIERYGLCLEMDWDFPISDNATDIFESSVESVFHT